jgi:hypothetical protein
MHGSLFVLFAYFLFAAMCLDEAEFKETRRASETLAHLSCLEASYSSDQQLPI